MANQQTTAEIINSAKKLMENGNGKKFDVPVTKDVDDVHRDAQAALKRQAQKGNKKVVNNDLYTLEQIERVLSEKVNLNHLDRLLAENPFIMRSITEQLANKRYEADKLKFDLKRMEADAYFMAKQKLVEANGRATEKAIEMMIARNEEFTNINYEYINAKKQVNKLEGLKETLIMRDSGLKVYSRLYASDYFSAGSESRGG